MAKIRVHELAKELGKSSKEMVDTLHNLGLDVKNHMSTMEDSQANWVKKRLGIGSNELESPGKPKAEPQDAPRRQPQAMPPKGHSEAKSQNVNNRPQPSERPQQVNRPPQSSGSQSINNRPQPGNNRPPQASGQQGFNRPQSSDRMQQGNRPQGSGSQPMNNRPQNRPPQYGGPQFNNNRPQGSGQQPYNRPPQHGGQQPYNNRPQGSGSQPYNNRPQQVNRPVQNSGQPSYNNRPQQGNRPQQQSTPSSPSYNRGPAPGGQRPAAGAGRPVNQRPVQGAPTGGTPGQSRPKPANQANQRPVGSPANAAKKNVKKPAIMEKSYSRPFKRSKHKRKKEPVELQTPELISVEDSIMVRDLAEKLNKNSAEIMKKLMELGVMATINQLIDYETVEILASLYEVKVERAVSEEEKILEEIIDDDSSLMLRPPVVTVMGHVDHGKTSLLDRIRKADVVSGEAGGITQHIGAYQVKVHESRVTFIDTPGHEAFTAMRARGANLTDIVILVVAADDGVMPQTVEAINHIKAAKVPFIVAINKIDKPAADPERLKQQLTEFGIVAEEWGGDIIFVPVSAKTGQGIDTLLEMVLLVAEMKEIKANPDRTATGVVIEGQLDKGRGAIATVLVLNGTLNIGDHIICGTNWCRVRAMSDHRGRRVDQAYPSMPVEIMGWSDVPEAGEKVVVCDEKIAKEIINLRVSEKKMVEQNQSSRVSLDDFFKQIQDAVVKELNLIIKGDVQGSVEALAQSLLRLSTSEVKVNVIHSAVGAITETDVMLASASNAIIIGFNVRPDTKARRYAEDDNIDVRLYRVIYEAIDDVKKAMTGLLDPQYKEKYLGRAEARTLFKIPNIGVIAGSYVSDGVIQRNAKVRVLRDGVIVYEGVLSSLKRFKDDAKEVLENYECGIGIKDFNDLKEGDTIEAYTMVEVPREL